MPTMQLHHKDPSMIQQLKLHRHPHLAAAAAGAAVVQRPQGQGPSRTHTFLVRGSYTDGSTSPATARTTASTSLAASLCGRQEGAHVKRPQMASTEQIGRCRAAWACHGCDCH